MVKIYTYGFNYFSNLIKYKERITLPEIIVPQNNHFIYWMDLYNNQKYGTNITDIFVTKDYYLVATIIGYVNYYISDKLVVQNNYTINSTFIVLNKNIFPNNKINYWKNKINGDKYDFDKEYKLEGDIDLFAVLEQDNNKKEDENNNNSLIISLSIVGIFIILVVVFFVYRYYKLKKGNQVNFY